MKEREIQSYLCKCPLSFTFPVRSNVHNDNIMLRAIKERKKREGERGREGGRREREREGGREGEERGEGGREREEEKSERE